MIIIQNQNSKLDIRFMEYEYKDPEDSDFILRKDIKKWLKILKIKHDIFWTGPNWKKLAIEFQKPSDEILFKLTWM